MAFWSEWPTWAKIAAPVGVLGVGWLMLRGGDDDTGEAEGGEDAVLPLITPSVGPSFPAGVNFGGGNDYAPLGPPPKKDDEDLMEDDKDDKDDKVPAPPEPGPPKDEGPISPPNTGPPPLTPGQSRKISAKLEQIRRVKRGRLERIDRQLQKKLDEINALPGKQTRPDKVARRAAARTAAASARAAAQAWAAAASAAARAMFGEGRG